MTDKLTAAHMWRAFAEHSTLCGHAQTVVDAYVERAQRCDDEAARREAKAFRDFYTDEEDRTACRAAKDGECYWSSCPQIKDSEPSKSGRHCPLDNPEAARREAVEERSQWRKDQTDAMLNELVAKLPDAPPPPADDLVKRIVDRFLCWRLPDTFNPDCHISFDKSPDARGNPITWPIGTNLFCADEAKAMVEHIAGPEIEALRAERDAAMEALSEKLETLYTMTKRAEAAGARVAALEGAAKAYRQAEQDYVFMAERPDEEYVAADVHLARMHMHKAAIALDAALTQKEPGNG